MPDKIKPGPATPVRQHGFDGDERSNIPTAELESFVRDEDKRPTIVLPEVDLVRVGLLGEERESGAIGVGDPVAHVRSLRSETARPHAEATRTCER
jgi:hypothetical protein